MKLEELEEQVFNRYNPQEYKGVADYIDQFQTRMEELDALGTKNYGDADKNRTLIRNLKTDSKLLSLIQICHDDMLKDFEETSNYLRENVTSMDRTLKKIQAGSSKMLNTHKEEIEERTPDIDECLKIVQNLMKETSLKRTFNALQSLTVCTSLNIPGDIWHQLEPQMKEKINEIKAEVRKKRAQESKPMDLLPPQYAKVAQKVNAMVATMCTEHDEESDSDTSTNDEALHVTAFHTST
jgi:hypothetical protein